MDEIEGINKKYIEVLAKSEIHTSEEFLSTDRSDILTFKGFGEKTVDKVTDIIMGAVENRETNSTKDSSSELEIDGNEFYIPLWNNELYFDLVDSNSNKIDLIVKMKPNPNLEVY